MTWIRTVNEDDATGELKAIYAASVKAYGWIPNIRRALSLSPKALRHYTQLSATVYSSGPLPEVEREMIATVVSVVNHCHY